MLRCSGQGVHVVWKTQKKASSRSPASIFRTKKPRFKYICQLQLGWHPVAVVQYTFTHKQYIEQHKSHYTQGSKMAGFLCWGITWIVPRPTRSLTQVHSTSRTASVSKIELWTWNRPWQIRVHDDKTHTTHFSCS